MHSYMDLAPCSLRRRCTGSLRLVAVILGLRLNPNDASATRISPEGRVTDFFLRLVDTIAEGKATTLEEILFVTPKIDRTYVRVVARPKHIGI